MSYLEDTIDWQAVETVDAWLDAAVAAHYQGQPLAQDYARVAKATEETGEAIAALIGATGQNPRKGVTHTMQDVTDELADVAMTAILAIQHFTKNASVTRQILRAKLAALSTRVPETPDDSTAAIPRQEFTERLAAANRDLENIKANLASLNELCAELTRKIADDPDFASMTETVLREHSWLNGFSFQGENAPLDWLENH